VRILHRARISNHNGSDVQRSKSGERDELLVLFSIPWVHYERDLDFSRRETCWHSRGYVFLSKMRILHRARISEHNGSDVQRSKSGVRDELLVLSSIPCVHYERDLDLSHHKVATNDFTPVLGMLSPSRTQSGCVISAGDRHALDTLGSSQLQYLHV